MKVASEKFKKLHCSPSDRLINFSEACFGIASTIAVFPLSNITNHEIKLACRGSYDTIWEFVEQEYVKFIATFVVFHFVCRSRGRHVKVFDALDFVDDTIQSLNALHLFLVFLIPALLIAFAMTSVDNDGDIGLVLALLVVLSLVDISSLLVLIYSRYAGLFNPVLSKSVAPPTTIIKQEKTVLENEDDYVMVENIPNVESRGESISSQLSETKTPNVIEDEVRVADFHKHNAQHLEYVHFRALVSRFIFIVVVNLLCIPIVFAGEYGPLISVCVCFVLGSSFTKKIVSCIPRVGSYLKGELRQPLNKNRLKNFRDGVFSILASLVVLDVDVAKKSSFHDIVQDNRPFLLAFATSFSVIIPLWIFHQHLLNYIVSLGSGWRLVNQLVMSLVCFVPFCFILVADVMFCECTESTVCPTPPGPNCPARIQKCIDGRESFLHTANILTFITNLIVSLAFLFLWIALRWMAPKNIQLPDDGKSVISMTMTVRGLILPTVCSLGIFVSFGTEYSVAILGLIPVFWLIMNSVVWRCGVKMQTDSDQTSSSHDDLQTQLLTEDIQEEQNTLYM